MWRSAGSCLLQDMQHASLCLYLRYPVLLCNIVGLRVAVSGSSRSKGAAIACWRARPAMMERTCTMCV